MFIFVLNLLFRLSNPVQNKVAEAEQKFKQIQEQVEGITQRYKDLQPQCSELKSKAQKKNNQLKSGEVRHQPQYQTNKSLVTPAKPMQNRMLLTCSLLYDRTSILTP